MGLSGSQKVALLLCRFRDSRDVEPNPRSFYEDLLVTRGSGGLNDYWIAASLGAINLDGSEVHGWTTIDLNLADFLAARPGRWDKILGAIEACGIDATQYACVIAHFAVSVNDGGAQNGVLAGPGDANVTFLAHETGHIFGLDHSYDLSSRKAADWSQEGEYFDRYDIMSAMNVLNDWGHRFSPRGPLLSTPYLTHMGWLPPDRVYRNIALNSSGLLDLDLVALEHPEVPGLLCAHVGRYFVEFRMNVGWDAGLPRPGILIHTFRNSNAVIQSSDLAADIQDWQPGQTHGWSYAILGGLKIGVLSFDVGAKRARIRIEQTASSPLVDERYYFGSGVLGPGGTLVVLVGDRIFRIPMPQPEYEIERGLVLRSLEEVAFAGRSRRKTDLPTALRGRPV